MTVGLNDVYEVSQLLHPSQVPDLRDTELVLSKLSIFHWRRKNVSLAINVLAQALYSLFSADGKDSDLKDY